MAYSTLENITDLDLQGVLNFPNLNTPQFYPIFLFVVFFVFTSLAFFREVSREGKGNFLASAAVGGFMLISVSVVLSLLGVIQTAVLVTSMTAGLVFIALFLITSKK